MTIETVAKKRPETTPASAVVDQTLVAETEGGGRPGADVRFASRSGRAGGEFIQLNFADSVSPNFWSSTRSVLFVALGRPLQVPTFDADAPPVVGRVSGS